MRRSVIRWNGGKARIRHIVKELIGEKPLVELFCGSAALSFTLQLKDSTINDTNSELINFMRHLQQGNIKPLKGHPSPERFFDTRKEFNENLGRSTEEQAQRFFELCWSGFSGKYNVNRQGYYNTSYSDTNWYSATNPLDYTRIMTDWKIFNLDYKDVPIPNDSVIFADPPYDQVLSDIRVNYTSRGFDVDDQIELANYLNALSATHPIITTNFGTQRIINGYKNRGFAVYKLNIGRTGNMASSETFEVIMTKNLPEWQEVKE